jgi:hypothetical protein
MKSLTLIFLAIGLSLSATSCSSPSPKHASQGKPDWVDNPQTMGNKVALGQAAPHINGRAEQRKLAHTRALDELSRQMGVQVTTQTDYRQTMTDTSSRSNIQSQSSHRVEGTRVKAVIKAEWFDPSSNVFYILIAAE